METLNMPQEQAQSAIETDAVTGDVLPTTDANQASETTKEAATIVADLESSIFGLTDFFAWATGTKARKGEDTPRAYFPGFTMSKDVEDKIETIDAALNEGNVEKVYAILQDAREHFGRKLRRYARKFHGEMNSEHRDLCDKDRLDPDLAVKLGNAIDEYSNLVGRNGFDLLEASKMAWATRDLFYEVIKEFDARREQAEQERVNAEMAAPTSKSGGRRKRAQADLRRRDEEAEQRRQEEVARQARLLRERMKGARKSAA